MKPYNSDQTAGWSAAKPCSAGWSPSSSAKAAARLTQPASWHTAERQRERGRRQQHRCSLSNGRAALMHVDVRDWAGAGRAREESGMYNQPPSAQHCTALRQLAACQAPGAPCTAPTCHEQLSSLCRLRLLLSRGKLVGSHKQRRGNGGARAGFLSKDPCTQSLNATARRGGFGCSCPTAVEGKRGWPLVGRGSL